MTTGQISFLALTTVGVMVVVLGKQSGDQNGVSEAPLYLYIFLAINPFLTGAGSIVLRSMSKVSKFVAAFWLNSFTILQSLFVIWLY